MALPWHCHGTAIALRCPFVAMPKVYSRASASRGYVPARRSEPGSSQLDAWQWCGPTYASMKSHRHEWRLAQSARSAIAEEFELSALEKDNKLGGQVQLGVTSAECQQHLSNGLTLSRCRTAGLWCHVPRAVANPRAELVSSHA